MFDSRHLWILGYRTLYIFTKDPLQRGNFAICQMCWCQSKGRCRRMLGCLDWPPVGLWEWEGSVTPS